MGLRIAFFDISKYDEDLVPCRRWFWLIVIDIKLGGSDSRTRPNKTYTRLRPQSRQNDVSEFDELLTEELRHANVTRSRPSVTLFTQNT